ncbi:MAG: hypothetical protein KJO81_01585 [Gammaproteobacteria bacterium]|nr:hypothetical protein [Gammaproteobacteria bacterium]
MHSLIGAVFASLLGIAGYMVIWAGTDSAWKQKIDTKVEAIVVDLDKLETRLANHPHGSQILPEASLRLQHLETWQTRHIQQHRNNP